VNVNSTCRFALPALLFSMAFAVQAQVDVDAAIAVAKRNDCFKCHAIDKDKKAPAYKKIAARLKARSYGSDYVVRHVTTGPKVRLEDGTEEDHKIIDTRDPAELDNLARWILSLASAQ
jgi:cytochrome c